MPLQHRGTVAIQFVLERANRSGMIVANVVDAISGIEVENALVVGSE